MNLDVYDQYGHLMLYPIPSGAVSILTPYSANISTGSLVEAPAGEPGTFSLPITFNPSRPEEGKAYTLTIHVGGAFASQTFHVVDTPVQILATPTANPASGAVAAGTQVSLSAAAGATIYYTTDGSTPTRTNGLVYSVPIVVNSAMTVKALAVQNGMSDSDIMSESYTISVQKSPLDLINEASESGDWAGVDESTFGDAGVTGVTNVTPEHLDAIKIALEIDSAPYPRTLSQIQTIVSETIETLMVTAIYDYLNPFGGGSVPTVELFSRAGITGVDASNLDDILDELSRAYQESKSGQYGTTPMSTKQDIQDVIDLYLGL
ncbi:hypothetical protein D3C81_1340040 [compost metagenome]